MYFTEHTAHQHLHIKVSAVNWVKTGRCHSAEVYSTQGNFGLSWLWGFKKKKRKGGCAVEADTAQTSLVPLNDYWTVCWPPGVSVMSREKLNFFPQVIEDLDCLLCHKWHGWWQKVLLHMSKWWIRSHVSLSCQTCRENQLLLSPQLLQYTVYYSEAQQQGSYWSNLSHTSLGLNWMRWKLKLDSQALFIRNRKACVICPKLVIGRHGLFTCSRARELNMTSLTLWSAMKVLLDQKLGKVGKKLPFRKSVYRYPEVRWNIVEGFHGHKCEVYLIINK